MKMQILKFQGILPKYESYLYDSLSAFVSNINVVMESFPVTMIAIFKALRIYIITVTSTTHHFTQFNNIIATVKIFCADTMIIMSDCHFNR